LTTLKVLLVDDDPDMRILYRLALRQAGLEVIEAASGKEALSLARTEKPDLVLLDVMMPAMDGYEVCRRLRADPQMTGLPVLMVSAKGTGSDREKGARVGANGFVIKSDGPRALIARVLSLLSSSLPEGQSLPIPATGPDLRSRCSG
jgi:DNA-binding response OmpR family regulator